jgi:hypothetical protein
MKTILIICASIFFCLSAFSELRTWTMVDEKVFEAEFITRIGDKFVFKTSKGKQIKILMTDMSPADIEYISIATPPRIEVDFVKSETPFKVKTSLVFANELPPRILYYNFGAKAKQKSAGTYEHELVLEYYAFGKQVTGKRYILLDHAKESFTLTRANELSFAFRGEREAMIMQYSMHDLSWGNKYAGNVVTVTDVRGEIIAHSASQSWMLDYLDNIKKLPVGAFCDKTGTRQLPSPPKAWY